MLKKIFLLFLLGIIVTNLSCAAKKEEKKSTTVYSNLTSTGAADTSQNLSFTLTDVTECYYDSTSGLVRVFLGSNSTASPFLSIKIKGYQSTATTYTCTQAADNKQSVGSVGSYFDSCGVQFGVYSSAGGSTVNQYATYRDNTTVQLLNYSGSCSVSVTEVNPTIRGTVSCGTMIQSYYQGSPVNPINNSTTLSLSGDFYCTFGESTLTKLKSDYEDHTEMNEDSINSESSNNEY